MKAYYYCNTCTIDNRTPVAFCGIRTGRTCFTKHLQNIYNNNINSDNAPVPPPQQIGL
jgi:hypothetical protein